MMETVMIIPMSCQKEEYGRQSREKAYLLAVVAGGNR